MSLFLPQLGARGPKKRQLSLCPFALCYNFSLMLKLLPLFVLALLLVNCQTETVQEATPPPSTYTLVLTDTTVAAPSWLGDYNKKTSLGNKTVISGFPHETPDEVIARLPWMLQPGVDTLLIDQRFLPNGQEICDSVASWSPTTVCRIN